MSGHQTDVAGTPHGGGPGPVLVPGAMLGKGRYRLLAQAGVDVRCNAHLWRAKDAALGRDVALTVLLGGPADPEAATRARRTVERAMHAASFNHPGVSRVLDVLGPGNGLAPEEGALGLVIAEWTQGTDLIDLIVEGPLPSATASRLLEPLAAAVESAHHAGLVLGTDHPQRIRVTPDGQLRLAFPGTRPEATPRDDVRGLGALLYLLLTGRWALPNGPDALPVAPTGPDGSVVAPSALQPAVSPQLSSVAVRSLEDASIGGIRTSAAIMQVLAQISEEESRTALVNAGTGGKPARGSGAVWTTAKPVNDKRRRIKLALGMVLLTIATIAVVIWLAVQVMSFFTESPKKGGGPTVAIGQSAAPGPTAQTSQQPTPAQGEPVEATSVTVYNVAEDPDNPGRVNRTIDGDPNTTWKTDTYLQQFPSLKPGIGVMANFNDAMRLTTVVVDSPSAGTRVEIRTAPSDNAELGETKVVGSATLSAGQTQIRLQPHEATQHFLIWITQLSGTDRKFQSELGELTFLRGGN